MVDLLDFDRRGLTAELGEALELPPFRARQLIQWLHRRRVRDFDAMTDIAKPVRAQLADRYRIFRPNLAKLEKSRDGSKKYLFELDDGSQVESVFIKQDARNTLCVSSQVGCALACAFCRTGLMGLRRNLKTHEIIGQVLAVKDELEASANGSGPEEFSNIVFMGMGEPLHNFDAVTCAVRILNDDLGHSFSGRKITLSTAGLVPAIKRFGETEGDAHLAVSLNATTDEVRDEIMPINRRFPLEVLLDTLRNYPMKRRNRITLEYVMLRDVNDTQADLSRLPKLIKGLPSKINLIPYNANAGLPFEPPKTSTINHWQRTLLDQGLTTTVRWSKGEDISAACGQLATPTVAKNKQKEQLH